MEFEELKAEAKRQGYNLIKIRNVKLLPCTCGSNRREHWYMYRDGIRFKGLICHKCGKEALGKTEIEAKENWNRMIKEELNERNNNKVN